MTNPRQIPLQTCNAAQNDCCFITTMALMWTPLAHLTGFPGWVGTNSYREEWCSIQMGSQGWEPTHSICRRSWSGLHYIHCAWQRQPSADLWACASNSWSLYLLALGSGLHLASIPEACIVRPSGPRWLSTTADCPAASTLQGALEHWWLKLPMQSLRIIDEHVHIFLTMGITPTRACIGLMVSAQLVYG